MKNQEIEGKMRSMGLVITDILHYFIYFFDYLEKKGLVSREEFLKKMLEKPEVPEDRNIFED